MPVAQIELFSRLVRGQHTIEMLQVLMQFFAPDSHVGHLSTIYSRVASVWQRPSLSNCHVQRAAKMEHRQTTNFFRVYHTVVSRRKIGMLAVTVPVGVKRPSKQVKGRLDMGSCSDQARLTFERENLLDAHGEGEIASGLHLTGHKGAHGVQAALR